MPLSPDHAGRAAALPPLPRSVDPDSPEAAVEVALLQAPGQPIVMLRPSPVRVRGVTGRAIAYTVTHVLIERPGTGENRLRWESSWLVRRLPLDTSDADRAQPS